MHSGKELKPLVLWDILDKCCIASPKPMTQAIEQKSTLYDRDLNLWLEEAVFHPKLFKKL